jgi:hypothetical protein
MVSFHDETDFGLTNLSLKIIARLARGHGIQLRPKMLDRAGNYQGSEWEHSQANAVSHDKDAVGLKWILCLSEVPRKKDVML